jgi:hypothetical protein
MLQAPTFGTTLKRTGYTILVVGLTSSIVFGLSSAWLWINDYKLLWVSLNVLIPVLMFFGGLLYWRGRQYAAKASAESIITDAKPHLLYLRSFRSDYTTAKELFRVYAQLPVTTEEEQLADALRPIGELVAIGRPGESLPTPGAARIYTSDEEWKDVVKSQMQISRLVVIRAALGENVLWELTQAVRTLEPQKLLILVLKMKAKDYKSFCIKASPILGASLPERTTRWRFSRVTGFINFAAGWEPSFLAAKAPYFRKGSFNRLAKYALRPVFELFGLDWQPPPISASQIAMIVPFVFTGAVVVLVAAILI